MRINEILPIVLFGLSSVTMLTAAFTGAVENILDVSIILLLTAILIQRWEDAE